MVSIIIVNYNGREFTRACLQSLFAVPPVDKHEIILVDNCSSDGSVEMIRAEFPGVVLLKQNVNEGFSRANNIGARAARGEYLYFLNNDTLFTQDIISPLKEFMEANKSIGVAAPMLLHPDGTFQLSYGNYPSFINEMRTKRNTAMMKNIPDNRIPKKVDWVSFAAVMIRRSAFENIHGFDERYFMYFEDADFCYRMQKAGYKTYYCAEYSIIHFGGGSWSNTVTNKIKTEYRRSQIIYYQTHRSSCETFALRIFLILRFMLLVVYHVGEDRRRAISIIKLAIFFDANSH
jgi:GT2 family glycosyltransferase